MEVPCLKTLITFAALLSFAASAHALTTQNYIGGSFQGLDENQSVMTSGTTPQDVDVQIGAKGVFLYISSTAASPTANIQLRSSKGVILISETVTVIGVVSRTYLPPIPFYDVKVSPTGGLTGTNTLHINIQQPK
jgi:hypothetical protein